MNVRLESDSTFKRVQAWMLRDTNTSGIKRVTGINAAIATDVGTQRNQNQDRTVIVRGKDYHGDVYVLAMLCDGMGGMLDGEYCAATTIAAFLTSFFKLSQRAGMPNDWLVASAELANKVVFEKYAGAGGSTLSAIFVKSGGKANWLNVGDSRIYKASNDVTQISQDDTIAGQLGKSSTMSQRMSELLQYIGIGDDLEPHVSRMTVDEPASFLLTSDGVHFLPSETLNSLIAKADDSGTCAKRLVEVAKWCGGHDNGSVAVIDVQSLKAFDSLSILPGQYDIWDPFGELQIYDASVDIVRHPYVAEKYLGKRKSSINSDDNRRMRKVRPVKVQVEIKSSDSEAAQDRIQVNELKEAKTEKKPQLKISFPVKDE